MRNFFIITNKLRDIDLSVTRKTEEFLIDRGCVVYKGEAGPLSDGHYTKSSDVPPDTDCVITIGGDGTLIGAARDTADLELPILGINQGTLGYLTDTEANTLEESLSRVLKGDFNIEERMMLYGKILDSDNNLKTGSRALNDVVVRNSVMKTVDYGLSVNQKFLSSFKADGMIVCTPTGSTAYSLSAGGPIIEPMARLMAITPICPHTLNTRSIVISAEQMVEIEISDDNSSVIFDGQPPVALNKGDIVNVRPSSHVTRIVRTFSDSFLTVLANKFRS